MTDRELSFKIRNINQAFTAEIKIRVSALGLGMSECSGCQNEEEKVIRLISERVGQGPEFSKYYCLDHAKQSLNQLGAQDFEMENKAWILNTLGGYLQDDKKELEKHVAKEAPEFVDPSGQYSYRKEDKPLCLNVECQAEINDANKASGFMSCQKCEDKVKEKMKSGEWERTTRGGWIKKAEKELEKKTDPSLELEEDKNDVDGTVEEARKKLEQELLNNGGGEKSGFDIPLKKVTDKEVIEGVKQQLAEEEKSPEEKSSIRPATEEEVKEAIEQHNEEQADKYKFVATNENLIKGWGLLTEEEKNTLNSKQKWNLREKRKRQMIKEGLLDPNTGQLTSKLIGSEGKSLGNTLKDKEEMFKATKNQAGLKLDPSGTDTTGVKYVDKPETTDKLILETNDKNFKEFVEEKSCFHIKEKFWQFFNKSNLPHIEKNSHWFFYINIIKKDKCLCECLNDIRQARTTGETAGKHNYKQMYTDLKKTKEIDYKSHRQELLKLAKENRELKTVIQKKINENAKINKALLMTYKKGKDDWTKISKLFLEHKPKGKDKNYEAK